MLISRKKQGKRFRIFAKIMGLSSLFPCSSFAGCCFLGASFARSTGFASCTATFAGSSSFGGPSGFGSGFTSGFARGGLFGGSFATPETAGFARFGLLVEHLLSLFESNGFGVGVFVDFDIIEAAGTFDVGAVSAVDNHDVAPVSDDRIDFGLVEFRGSFEVDGIGVVIFDLDIVFAGFEIGAEGAASGDQGIAVLCGAEFAG